RPEAPYAPGAAFRLSGGPGGTVTDRIEVLRDPRRDPTNRRRDCRTHAREPFADTLGEPARLPKHRTKLFTPGVFELVPSDLATDGVDIDTGLLPSLDGLLAVNRSRSGLILPQLHHLLVRHGLALHLLVRQVVPGFLVTGEDRGKRGTSLLKTHQTD